MTITNTIPNQWYSSFEFEEEITSFTLSFHGYMMCLGFSNGDIVILDSETGSNRYKYNFYNNEITSTSFSRDGKLIAIGDKSGNLKVFDFLQNKIIFSKKYKETITKAEFSVRSLYDILVIIRDEENCGLLEILNIENNEEHFLHEYSISACWCCKNDNESNGNEDIKLLSTNGESIYLYDESLNLISTIKDSEKKKQNTIQEVKASHTGNLFLTLTKESTSIRLLNQTTSVIAEFNDKYSHMTFDSTGEYVILSSNERDKCNLTIFKYTSETINNLKGPSETVKGLISHPIQPIIYSIGSSSVRIWTPTYCNSWSAFMPGFVEIYSNVYYDEKENEFDEEEINEEVSKIESKEKIDIFTQEKKYVFQSDKEWPDQLFYLPLNINALLEK